MVTTEKKAEYNRRYRQKNRDKRNAYARQVRAISPEKQREADKRYYQKNREILLARKAEKRAAVRTYLRSVKSVPCIDCGGLYDPECMDFDHVRGTKLFAVGSEQCSRGLAAIIDEVAKCDVVCSNCHRLRTKRRRA